MLSALDSFKKFDLTNSEVSIWTFKKSYKDKKPVFNGRWIDTTDALDGALRDAVSDARNNVTETMPYALLAQNNEQSALEIDANETYATSVISSCSDLTDKRKVKNLKDISNADFYAVKFVHGDDVLYAVRKTDSSWRTRSSKGLISVVYKDDQLELDQSPKFTVSKYFDFFIIGSEILVTQKSNFESILVYKQSYISDFNSLKSDPEFLSLFTDVKPLVDYVGDNKIQLRRAYAIREKANYKNADFMKRLIAESQSLGFGISFDDEGKIVATPETCRDIFQALLDHRLDSRLSQKTFDVDHSTAV